MITLCKSKAYTFSNYDIAVFEIIKHFGGDRSASSVTKNKNIAGGKHNLNKLKKSKSTRKLNTLFGGRKMHLLCVLGTVVL